MYDKLCGVTNLHRVRHAVVIIAVIDLGEKVLAELENRDTNIIWCNLLQKIF